MEINLDWHEDYACGIEEIDAQHQRFLKLVRLAYQALGDDSKEDSFSKILDELQKYAVFHFQCEELLMQLYKYPKYLEQRKEHKRIKQELRDQIEQIVQQKGDMIPLIHFLTKWFVNHTSFDDKEMGAFIQEVRVNA